VLTDKHGSYIQASMDRSEARHGQDHGARSPGDLDRAALLVDAVDAAGRAGALLHERFRAGRSGSVTSKSSPTDLVSEADLAAERAIHELLAQRRPGDGLLAEEGGERPGTSGLRWVVDPLDGTINFLFGIPHWCVSVAVEDRLGALAGAIFDPNRDELFTAIREGPALLNGSGLAPRKEAELAGVLMATGLSYEAARAGGPGPCPRSGDPTRTGSPSFRECSARPRVDRGGPLRRLLRAVHESLGHRRGYADLRTRGPARAGAPDPRGSSVRGPREPAAPGC